MINETPVSGEVSQSKLCVFCRNSSVVVKYLLLMESSFILYIDAPLGLSLGCKAKESILF